MLWDNFIANKVRHSISNIAVVYFSGRGFTEETRFQRVTRLESNSKCYDGFSISSDSILVKEKVHNPSIAGSYQETTGNCD